MGLFTLTLAATLATATGSMSVFRGPFFREPLIGILFASAVLLMIPAGFVLTAASTTYDQQLDRQSAVRGAMYGAVLFAAVVGLLYLLTPSLK